MANVRAIPEGYHTITPSLTVNDAKAAIEFYKRAFGAQDRGSMASPDGKIVHAEIQIGNSIVMLQDEFPQMGALSAAHYKGSPVSVHLYVEDADAAFKKAVDAGAKPVMPLENTFWGDRYGVVVDPFGLKWGISTHIRDVSMEEMERVSREMFGPKK